MNVLDHKNIPELLAPAGDWESMRAAVANGANAVYFGLEGFNARARATNFTMEELPQIMEYLHRHNVRGFVTLNILIFSTELHRIVEFVIAVAKAGVDAVIVQDLGLVKLIKSIAPTLHVHASTQMTLSEARGIEFVRELGVERVVLARELSLEEIQKITQVTDMPVEVFVHGALCVAYSGQCLTSEALGGRSANRGQCAQACRLPYELIVDGKVEELGDKAYLLSPQDLAAYDLIKPLIDAGVISFKIEGRLKGGPYVASTTQTYRRAIDAATSNTAFELQRREVLDLAQTFSRGLTTGFLEGVNHQKLVRARFPKSRGIEIGKVVRVDPRQGVQVKLREAVERLIQPGDGVLFDLGRPDTREPGGRVWKVIRKSVREVLLEFGNDEIDFAAVPVGCTVWKTDDPWLRKHLEQSYTQDQVALRLPIDAEITGEVGSELTLRLKDAAGNAAEATWPGPISEANKNPATYDTIHKQLDRLGDTPYQLQSLAFQLQGNLHIPHSVLNDLRRRACADLWELQQSSSKHPITAHAGNRVAEFRNQIAVEFGSVQEDKSKLSILVRNMQQLETVIVWQQSQPDAVENIYCDFEDLRKYSDAVALARSNGIEIGIAPLRIWKPNETGFQSIVARAAPGKILVRNLASISYFQEQLPDAALIGDFSLNVTNEITAQILLEKGLSRLTPSYDMNWEQLAELLQHINPEKFEAVIHQHMPMFHMEHCVFAAFLSTGKDHRDCGRPCEEHKVELKDRVGALFPVLPDTGCRNTVFNSLPQSAAEYIPQMQAAGIRYFRIDLLREQGEDITLLLDAYAELLSGKSNAKAAWKQLKAINQFGVTRGTLQLV